MSWLGPTTRTLRSSAVDALVVAVVALPTLMDAWWNEAGTRQADALTYALAVASLLPLLLRRRWPLVVALACGAALTGLYVLGHHGELLNLPVMVALYTVAVQGDRRRTVVVAVVAGAWSGLLGFTSDDPIGARGGSPVLEVLVPLVPLALGEAVRSRRELVAYALAEREREAERRVALERAQVAREVHDLVAHTIAAVNVQVAAAAAAFDTNPEAARRALAEARGSGRAALQELRATVALLRQDEGAAAGLDGSGAGPAPGLDRLDQLTRPAAAAGVAVTIEDERGDVVLSDAAQLAAYRIIQESLTNVLKHSRARRARVALQPTGGGLVVQIDDDGGGSGGGGGGGVGGVGGGGGGGRRGGGGGGAHGEAGGAGFGLVGMAERARAVGGHLEHGPLPGGGYRVRAVLPAGRPGP